MSFYAQFDRLAAFLLNLECLDADGQREAFMSEVIEAHGTYEPPERDEWSSHLFEIGLHGVFAIGANEDEAIRNWKKAAWVQVANLYQPQIQASDFDVTALLASNAEGAAQ